MQSQDALLNVIVAADYTLVNNADAMVIGVDSDGISYILEEDGAFSISSGDFEVTNVSAFDPTGIML